jgi:anti-sigma B factor antagonist
MFIFNIFIYNKTYNFYPVLYGDIKMDMEEKKAGNVDIIILTGRLDAVSSNNLENKINTMIDDGSQDLVVNFQGVDYISSSGLRVMLAALKRTKKEGGDIKLSCLKPYVMEVFDISGFTQLFEIFEEEEEAINR